MMAYFGPWGAGAVAVDAGHTRWAVGGGNVRETMGGLSWIPAGVEYTTNLAEPERTELRGDPRAHAARPRLTQLGDGS